MFKQFVKELRKGDFSMVNKHLKLKDLLGASATFFCLFHDTKTGFDCTFYEGPGFGIGITVNHVVVSFSPVDQNFVYSIGTGLSTAKLSVSAGATYTHFSPYFTDLFRKKFSAINKSVKEKALGRTALVASRKYSGSIAK